MAIEPAQQVFHCLTRVLLVLRRIPFDRVAQVRPVVTARLVVVLAARHAVQINEYIDASVPRSIHNLRELVEVRRILVRLTHLLGREERPVAHGDTQHIHARILQRVHIILREPRVKVVPQHALHLVGTEILRHRVLVPSIGPALFDHPVLIHPALQKKQTTEVRSKHLVLRRRPVPRRQRVRQRCLARAIVRLAALIFVAVLVTVTVLRWARRVGTVRRCSKVVLV